MKIQNINPIGQNQRSAIVDILRGWALLSVVLVNYGIFFSFNINVRVPSDDIVSKVLKGIVQVFFQTKGWTLLSFLFGYGFSVLIKNISQRGMNPAIFFSRRMFWLLVIAFVNCCFYYGDVLKDYVMIGMIILLFHRISAKASLYFAIIILLLIPGIIAFLKSHNVNLYISQVDLQLYKSHNIFNVLWFGLKSGINESLSISKLLDWNLVMLACAFVGTYIQKIDFFGHLSENKKYIVRIFWAALAFAILIGAFHGIYDYFNWDVEKYYDIQFWFNLSQMVFFMAGICWLYVTGKLKRFLNSLQFIGRMTLTNYLLQNLITLLIFSGFGFGLLHKMPYSYHIFLALVVFISQLYFSKWWLSKYNYGFVEWIWRQLTYRKRLPIRKQTNGLP